MSVFRRRLMSASRKGSDIDMSNYMTIEALEDGLTAKLTRTVCEYSIDGGEWVSLGVDTYTPAINTGQTISFKANNPGAHPTHGIGTFTITKQCNLKGNCMSMIAYDDAANMTTVKDRAFKRLFRQNSTILEVSSDFLPATKTGMNSYSDMFYNCRKMVVAPKLPATTLGAGCYSYMFYGCSQLKIAPKLTATRLNLSCYEQMFYGCVSLENIQDTLLATDLNFDCYSYMFSSCHIRNNINIPSIKSSVQMDRCCTGMFSGCTFEPGVKIVLPAKKLSIGCYEQMFSFCTFGEGCSIEVHAETNLDYNGDVATSYFLDGACGGTVYCSNNYKGLGNDETLLKNTFREDFSVPSNIAVEIINL